MSRRPYISSDGRFTPKRARAILGFNARMSFDGGETWIDGVIVSFTYTSADSSPFPPFSIGPLFGGEITGELTIDASNFNADPFFSIADNTPDDGLRWRVAWTDHETGVEGIGEPTTRPDAESWAAAMNAKYPTMTHWIVPA